jgi:hypothetical protein
MDIADRLLWQRSCVTDAVEDDYDRFLDMAAFADGRLDSDERERIAEWLHSHKEAAGDIVAARALANAGTYQTLSKTGLARASALVGDTSLSPRGTVLAFPVGPGRRSGLAAIAQWGGLAAAMVVAGWLGFTLGVDASGMLARNGPGPDDGVVQELFGSSPAFFRDMTGGA